MRKILAFSTVLIKIKINKEVIYAIWASFKEVVASLVNINKRLFHEIITSWNILITGVVNITKQVINTTLASLLAILNSFRPLIRSLVTLNKQLFRAAVAFLDAIVIFFDFGISSSVRLIKQFILTLLKASAFMLKMKAIRVHTSAMLVSTWETSAFKLEKLISAILNSCSLVITNLFRINKKLTHGVASSSITIVSSSSSIIDSLIRINKQVISVVVNGILSSLGTIVSFLGDFLYSLGTVVSSFSAGAIILGAVIAAVLASLVGINKKLIRGVVRGVVNFFSTVLSSLGFGISSSVRLIKKVRHVTVASPRFIVTSLVGINKQLIHTILASLQLLRVILFPFIFVINNLVKVIKKILASLRFVIVTAGINKRPLRRILTYCSFIIACFVVVGVFITATTFIQLAAAILIYPLLVLFAYKLFAHKIRGHSPKRLASAIRLPLEPAGESGQAERSSVGISDIDKRVFLKLIGGTGITLFLISLFSKKFDNLVPSRYPGVGVIALGDSTGNKINPAQNSPLDGYTIAQIDDNTISFYGYTNEIGAWYILRVDTVAGSFRYVRGNSDFPGAWENRENLNYDYYNHVFKN